MNNRPTHADTGSLLRPTAQNSTQPVPWFASVALAIYALARACFVASLLVASLASAQTTSGNSTTGATRFTAKGCGGCHVAGIAKHANAINAGGHITHANTQGMGGAGNAGTDYNDIAAYFATLFTSLASQSVTFETAKNIAIPNIVLGSAYGNYAGLRKIADPSRGTATYSGTTATYTPSADQCGFDAFSYQAYRTFVSGSTVNDGGTSNTRTVSLTISNPAGPNITSSLATRTGTYNGFVAFGPTSTGGSPASYVISAGTLPAGLALNGTTGVIFGTVTQVGSFPITLQARNCLNGNLAGQTSSKAITITIGKATQGAITARINGSSADAIFTYASPNGTATLSALQAAPVSSFAVGFASNNTSVCSVSGSTLTLVGAGSCTITATRMADANYFATADTINVTVDKANQTITFPAQTTTSRPYVMGGAFTVAPTAFSTSGIAVTYDSNTPLVCTLPGTTSTTVTMVAAGMCMIGANQAGNTNYNPAAEVPQTVTVNAIAPTAPTIGTGTAGDKQATITFSAPVNTGGSPITSYTATCSAAGQTTRTASAPSSPITVGTVPLPLTNAVTYACSVTATNVAGTGPASGTVMVMPSATPVPPTITSANNTTFTVLSASTFSVTATGTPSTFTYPVSGTLPTGVTFNTSTGVLSGTPASGTVGAYPLSITAANGTAPNATQSFTLTVQKASQSINFSAPANRAMSPTPFTISATATPSTLAVRFTTATPATCSVTGTSVTMLAVGTCTISANQAGNADYNAAALLQKSFVISQGPQAIVFPTQSPSTQAYSPSGVFAINPAGTSVDPNAPATLTGLLVSYASLTTGVCTNSGNAVTIISVGTCTIEASQTGNANYAAATPVTQDVTISVAPQAISWGAPSNQTFGTGGTFAISPFATGGGSGNSINYGSLTPGICTVSGTTVSKVSAGTCTLTANQAGDTNYAAAPTVQRSFAINASVATAPVATLITASDSQVVVDFDPSTSDGGSTISAYRATCNPGGIFTNAATSPIKVTGLTNTTAYTCAVVAQNAAGNSPASNPLMATPILDSGANLWANVCAGCHGATPAGVRFNAAGTTGTVINYVRSVQPLMQTQTAVQAFTLNELAEIAKYIETFVPPIAITTAFNTPVIADVSSHLTLGTVSFTDAAVVTPPANGSLSAFSGTQITYTPNPGYVGIDTFTYRGTRSGPAVNGDPHSVTITVNAPPAPVITSPAIAAGMFGAPFSYQITATNSPTSFAAAPLGGNFSINTMTGLISGTPMTTGSFTVTVSATNAGGTGMQMVDVTISKASQSITFGAQGNQAFSPGGTFTLSPVAAVNSPLVVSYSSLTLSVCTISTTTVTILTAGICMIAADQSGNANYEAALQVAQPINISATAPGAPTIGSATPGDTVAAIGFTPPASNGGSVITSYTATCVSPGRTTRTGTAAATPINVSILDNGFTYSCTVVATNSIGNSAASAAVNVAPTSTPVAPQITSANAATFTVGTSSTFAITATGTPAPTLALTGTLPSGVTFTAGTGALAGTPALGAVNVYPLTVTASNASGTPMQSFTLTVAKANQTISFTGPPSQPFTPSTINLTATATSGLPVTLASNTTSVCTISVTTLSLLTVGTCSITASQTGDANYTAATSVTQGFTVGQATQTINFPAQTPASRSFVAGSTFTINPTASASSGLSVIYSSITTGFCTVVGLTVTMVAPGTCMIAANQSGSANFLAATQATQSVLLNTTAPGAPTIGTASGGNAQATISFTPPASNGGSAITSYTASCSPGGMSASGGTSPIVVSGLTNNVMHLCSVTATNGVGTSAPSLNVSVTPLSGQGSALWTQVCDVCHTSVPSGNQLNGAGTSATVINYVRANQTLMAANSAVQALSTADLVDIATYIASVVPPNDVITTVNTPVLVDVNNHISLTSQPWSAFTSVEVVTPPTHGTLGAFTGTQIQYTPTTGYLGPDSFTYRGKHPGGIVFVGDPQTVSISVSPPIPAITSATNANGIFGQTFVYQITATNSPTSFDVTGLPGGLGANAAGLISGIPTDPGQFSVAISATNAGGIGGATLMLQIDPAAQTVSFGAQTSPRTFGLGASFTISPVAAGGASGNPIMYGSNTQSVCTVSGNTVTMVSAGTCTITADQAGNTNYAAATQAMQNVTINPTLPAAPAIGAATAGNTQAMIAFTPPASDGGSAITNYIATCVPGNITGTNALSPITVMGLVNGTAYSCSVAASNVVGSGPSSVAVPVTPLSGLALTSVVSRKLHGAAGSFDLVIDSTILIGAGVDVEPRAIGSGHTLVFTFNNPITSAGSVSVTDSASMTVGSASAMRSGNDVVVTLTSTPDNQRVTVTLTNVNGVVTPITASLGFLIGDVNNTRSVNSSDISGVKARSGQNTTGANFKFDLNASGSISSSDISAVKARSGLVLAP